jgi:hypothetical protein
MLCLAISGVAWGCRDRLCARARTELMTLRILTLRHVEVMTLHFLKTALASSQRAIVIAAQRVSHRYSPRIVYTPGRVHSRPPCTANEFLSRLFHDFPHSFPLRNNRGSDTIKDSARSATGNGRFRCHRGSVISTGIGNNLRFLLKKLFPWWAASVPAPFFWNLVRGMVMVWCGEVAWEGLGVICYMVMTKRKVERSIIKARCWRERAA